jgi:hypothetical protein
VGFAWQVIAGIATGVPNAYLETELSWRGFWMPQDGAVVLAVRGLAVGDAVLGAAAGLPGWLGLVAWCARAAVRGGADRGPGVRRLGPEIRLFAASYALYLPCSSRSPARCGCCSRSRRCGARRLATVLVAARRRC